MYGPERDRVLHTTFRSVPSHPHPHRFEYLHTETRRHSKMFYMANQACTACWIWMKIGMHVIIW